MKTPLPKRLCLAKNAVQSHHFPTAPKERIVAEWLQDLTERNSLKTEDLKNVLDWLTIVDDFTSELKSKLIQVTLIKCIYSIQTAHHTNSLTSKATSTVYFINQRLLIVRILLLISQ